MIVEYPVLPGLGRHVHHDPRSKSYPAGSFLDSFRTPKSVEWMRRCPIFDQGQLGSCTGEAAAGLVGTDRLAVKGNPVVSQLNAVSIYTAATRIDNIAGEYPPDDTGSTGLAVMKVLRNMGFVHAYKHAFSFHSMCMALQKTPVIAGIAWRNDSFDPDSDGMVSWTGPVVGGHEICIVGIDMTKQVVKFANSWGTSWGQNGYAFFTFDDFKNALSYHGDVTVPVWS